MRVRSTTDSVKLTIGGGKRAYFPTSSSTVSPYANGKKGRIRQFLQSRSKMLLLGLLFVFLFLYVSVFLRSIFGNFWSNLGACWSHTTPYYDQPNRQQSHHMLRAPRPAGHQGDRGLLWHRLVHLESFPPAPHVTILHAGTQYENHT